MPILGKLFTRSKKPEFGMEPAVEEYLLKLPRCNKDVVIASPEYGESQYSCEIVVAAAALLPWAEQHAETVWGTDQEEQAARRALPRWLRGALMEEDSASYVPHGMYEVMRPYVLDFVTERSARVYCLECHSVVADVQMERLDDECSGGWSCWTEVWSCPVGHNLYHERHEMHILRR